MQAQIIAATKPFMVETGAIGAFTAPQEDPAIDAAVYKLGPYGTAAKKLTE